jgi:creatinine amidohydrolase
VGLLEKMLGGASSFLEIGADEAYCGAPAEASAEEGRELIERLSTMIVESAREAWPELFQKASDT